MKARCYNQSNQRFQDYGGRGIRISDAWLDFKNFKNDMYKSFLEHVNKFGIKNTQLDRIDNNGNYSRHNCRWATYKEQARNTRRNRILQFNRESKCLSEWAEIFNIQVGTLHARLKRGWDIKDALITKVSNH
jgi:hypothetical protein